jgi:hypothetical protein
MNSESQNRSVLFLAHIEAVEYRQMFLSYQFCLHYIAVFFPRFVLVITRQLVTGTKLVTARDQRPCCRVVTRVLRTRISAVIPLRNDYTTNEGHSKIYRNRNCDGGKNCFSKVYFIDGLLRFRRYIFCNMNVSVCSVTALSREASSRWREFLNEVRSGQKSYD